MAAATSTSDSGLGDVSLTAVVWDMDGTITERGSIDFKRMKSRCKIPEGEDIIAWVRSRPVVEQPGLEAIIEEEEALGIEKQRLRQEAGSTIAQLQAMGVQQAILTRNNQAAVDALLGRVLPSDPSYAASQRGSEASESSPFTIAMGREFEPAKPYAAPLLHIMSCCIDPSRSSSTEADEAASGEIDSDGRISGKSSPPSIEIAPIVAEKAADTAVLARPPPQLQAVGAPAQPAGMLALRAATAKLAQEEPSLYPSVYMAPAKVPFDPAPSSSAGGAEAPDCHSASDCKAPSALGPRRSRAGEGLRLAQSVRSGVLMVGDTIDDMETAWRAGAVSCLVADVPPEGEPGAEPCKHYQAALDMADLVVERLQEVVHIAKGCSETWLRAARRAAEERAAHGRFR